MIARGFKSVLWVATVGGAALACYMVSLQVATERNELAQVEAQIIAAKRDIRSLQTELGTRGRLSQLEHWNAEVLALSAPATAQFLDNELRLARFEQVDPTIADRNAEVRMASVDTKDAEAPAPAPVQAPVLAAVAAAPPAGQPVVHRASLTVPPARSSLHETVKPAATKRAAPGASAVKPAPVRTAAAESAKAEKPSPSKGTSERKAKGRLDSGLASEIVAAARAEKKASGQGGN